MTQDERAALATKYRTLAELRHGRDAGGAVADRARLQALARAFPGALRELDLLALDEIERRAHALEADGPDEAWMEWVSAYHAALRAALDAREPRGSDAGAGLRDRAIARVADRFGVDAPTVRATVAPRGRPGP